VAHWPLRARRPACVEPRARVAGTRSQPRWWTMGGRNSREESG
jgi:hypothetical protein